MSINKFEKTEYNPNPFYTDVYMKQLEEKQQVKKGLKFDNGKNRLEILFCHFVRTLEGVGACCTYGANKYNESVNTRNWASVPNAKERYIGATLRHFFEYLKGNKTDPESGQKHLHHAIWNLLALGELENE